MRWKRPSPRKDNMRFYRVARLALRAFGISFSPFQGARGRAPLRHEVAIQLGGLWVSNDFAIFRDPMMRISTEHPWVLRR
jgi:hypothetical protein